MPVRVTAGKITQLKPETAYLVVQALRGWNAKPSRDSIVREICGVPRGCAERCINCIGKANAVMQLYEGKAVRPSEDRSEFNISLNILLSQSSVERCSSVKRAAIQTMVTASRPDA